MIEDLKNPQFNIGGDDAQSHIFYGGPLNNKVVMVPRGVQLYVYAYMGHKHSYRIFSSGAYYQQSERLQ